MRGERRDGPVHELLDPEDDAGVEEEGRELEAGGEHEGELWAGY